MAGRRQFIQLSTAAHTPLIFDILYDKTSHRCMSVHVQHFEDLRSD